jgi:hypothetical protein
MSAAETNPRHMALCSHCSIGIGKASEYEEMHCIVINGILTGVHALAYFPHCKFFFLNIQCSKLHSYLLYCRLIGPFPHSAIKNPKNSNHSVFHSQSNDLTRGTTELVQHFRLLGEFTSAQERCLT